MHMSIIYSVDVHALAINKKKENNVVPANRQGVFEHVGYLCEKSRRLLGKPAAMLSSAGWCQSSTDLETRKHLLISQ
jgi:hypothetical protein